MSRKINSKIVRVIMLKSDPNRLFVRQKTRLSYHKILISRLICCQNHLILGSNISSKRIRIDQDPFPEINAILLCWLYYLTSMHRHFFHLFTDSTQCWKTFPFHLKQLSQSVSEKKQDVRYWYTTLLIWLRLSLFTIWYLIPFSIIYLDVRQMLFHRT